MTLGRFRRDYDGEFVLTRTRLSNGQKFQDREWIANPIQNQHVSGRAAVIGSDLDRDRFDYARLQSHRGGLLGNKRLQTYSSGPTWQHMRLDFYVSHDKQHIQDLDAAGYQTHTVVYTSTRNCLNNPGKFYVVPFAPVLADTALSIYLACFDGHQNVFLLGYNNDSVSTNKDLVSNVLQVMQAYPTVTFFLVGTASNMPRDWRHLANVKCHTYPEFVSFCDI